MEQLVGPNVQVTLGVKQGRGFESFQKPLLVVASLEGHALNTNILASTPEPQFDAELVWETDKQAVRRLRTAKVPLKVDCFTLTNPSSRQKVGSILLNLLSAYIAPRGKASPSYPETWHKLICRNSDGTTPNAELLLSLRIEEVSDNEEHAMGDQCGLLDRLQNATVGPLQNKEKIIQVGPVLMGTDVFQLVIEIEAANLDALDLNKMQPSSLYFVCNVFGHKLRTSTLGPDLIKLWSTSQKLVVQVRSSVKFLRQQLESLLLLKIMSADCDVGFTTMDISSLVPTDNLAEFIERHSGVNGVVTSSRCFFTLANSEQEKAEENGLQAFADISLWLKYCSPVGSGEPNIAKSTIKKKSVRCLNVMEAGGDGAHCQENLTSYSQESSSVRLQLRKPASMTDITTEKSRQYMRPTSNLDQTLKEPNLKRVYNTFTLDISLENILFNELPPENRVFFKFHHPKAEIITTSHPEIVVTQIDKMMSLENIRCKLRFVSTTEEISRLLLAWPPKISVCAAISDQIVQLAITTLDIARLLSDKKRCIYPAAMIDLINGQEVGSLYISMNLENCGEHVEDPTLRSAKTSEQDLGPAVLDDRIAYQIVSELEDWKSKQQEVFKSELAAKQERHLCLLTAEFHQRRSSLEGKLRRNVEESRRLTESLHLAAQELQERAGRQAAAEQEVALRRDELERRYAGKFEELREASKRLEEDLYHKVKLIENKNMELLVTVQRLEKENTLLRQNMQQQESVLQDKNQKNSLTQEQTASLLKEMKVLEEKLENVTQSKAYFKKQWSQAVRELHSIKSEHQEAMQIQIRDFKEELKSLGFQRLLNEEVSELSNDQVVIQKLKAELSQNQSDGKHFNKKSSTIFTSRSSDSEQVPWGTRQQTQEEVETKLRQAINERDALLRTGNYSMDDRVLDQINKNIRKQINHVNNTQAE